MYRMVRSRAFPFLLLILLLGCARTQGRRLHTSRSRPRKALGVCGATGGQMSSPEATEKAWSTADNLRDLLTSSEQSLVETTSQNLFETPGSWFGAVREASDGVREADEEWVTVTPKYIADAQEGGRPMQAITRVRDAVDPNNPPAGAFQAKVVQVTPVESLAQVEKGPDGGMALTQPGQEGAGGAGDSSGAFVIPAGHTTRIDLSGPGQEVVLTESLTGKRKNGRVPHNLPQWVTHGGV